MEEIKQEIHNHNFFERWNSLETQWNNHLVGIDTLLVKDGEDDDEVIKSKTCGF